MLYFNLLQSETKTYMCSIQATATVRHNSFPRLNSLQITVNVPRTVVPAVEQQNGNNNCNSHSHSVIINLFYMFFGGERGCKSIKARMVVGRVKKTKRSLPISSQYGGLRERER